jgi:hypothetical protein
MNKILFSIALSLGLVLTACNPPSQTTSPNNNQNVNQNDMVSIEGIVNDQNDKPLADAKITIKDNDKILATTTTNAEGKFSVKVPKVFSDSYYIEAKKDLSDGNLSQAILVSTGEKADFIGNNKLKKTQLAVKPVPVQ